MQKYTHTQRRRAKKSSYQFAKIKTYKIESFYQPFSFSAITFYGAFGLK
jgi:hypothetical protein